MAAFFNRVLARPWIVVALVLCITVFLGYRVPTLVFNPDVEDFLPDDHPVALSDGRISEIFGDTTTFIVAIEPERGTVISPQIVALVFELSEALEASPLVDDVLSLTHADYVTGDSGGITSDPLLEDFGGTSAEIETLRERLVDWKDFYNGLIVSEDLGATQIIGELVEGLSPAEEEAFYSELVDRLAAYDDRYPVSSHLGGDLAIDILARRSMQDDTQRLVPITVLVILAVLLVSFRRFGGVALPMLSVLISTVWAIGAMAWIGAPISLVVIIVPVLLIAVGSAYGIHLFTHYYDTLSTATAEWNGLDGTRRDRRRARRAANRELVVATTHHVAVPVLLAGLTTVVGFLSLAMSPIDELRTFGAVALLGVVAAVLLTLFFVPAMLIIGPVPGARRRTGRARGLAPRGPSILERGLAALHRWVYAHSGATIALSVVVLGLSIWGATYVVVDNRPVMLFRRGSPIRVTEEVVRNNFAGSAVMDVMIEGTEPGRATRPEILQATENLADYVVEHNDAVGAASALSTIIKRMNQTFNVPESLGSNGMNTDDGDESSGADEDSFVIGDDDFWSGEASDFGFTLDGFDTVQGAGVDRHSAADIAADDAAYRAERDRITAEPLTPAEFVAIVARIRTDNDALAVEDADDFIDLVLRAFNYGGSAYYEIPYDPAKYPGESLDDLHDLINQYLLLYGGDITDFADATLEPQRARMQLTLRESGTVDVESVIADTRYYVDRFFPADYEIAFGGAPVVFAAIDRLIVDSQMRSLIVAVLIVFAILAVWNRSVTAGLIGSVPLAVAIVAGFGLMGLFGITFNFMTALVSVISIGIAVDYTIHFLETYRLRRTIDPDRYTAMGATYASSGKAIIYNALAVALGFSALMFSNFAPLQNIGALVCIVMLLATVGALTTLPAMITLLQPTFLERAAANTAPDETRTLRTKYNETGGTI